MHLVDRFPMQINMRSVEMIAQGKQIPSAGTSKSVH
jgi:hypothetical protein